MKKPIILFIMLALLLTSCDKAKPVDNKSNAERKGVNAVQNLNDKMGRYTTHF